MTSVVFWSAMHGVPLLEKIGSAGKTHVIYVCGFEGITRSITFVSSI